MQSNAKLLTNNDIINITANIISTINSKYIGIYITYFGPKKSDYIINTKKLDSNKFTIKDIKSNYIVTPNQKFLMTTFGGLMKNNGFKLFDVLSIIT